MAIASSRHEADDQVFIDALADEVTGIREASRLMVDKVTTMPRSKPGERVGQLNDDDMVRLARALVVFLGLAGT